MHDVFWDRFENQFCTRILESEHIVCYTAVFNYLERNNDFSLVAGVYLNLEGNDNNLSTGVFNSLAGVNHVLETYLFLKADLEYLLTAHPVETDMTPQD